MPLVLVHNDVVANPAHAWDDVEGVHYHYPSKYKGKIKTGESFVYYRGVHRANGKRGQAEYIGVGRIGEIWADPAVDADGKTRRAYYCSVEDYERFPTPVPAKIDGKTLEQIPSNLWRDGVRLLEQAIFDQIISKSNVSAGDYNKATNSTISIIPSANLIVPPKLTSRGGISGSRKSYRRSKRAKEVGDWAEQIVVKYLTDTLPGMTHLVHRAAAGETPGWDIDFIDAQGTLQRIEVKGTVASAFVGVDLTAGEKRAAELHGQSFWLYLVADCLTDNPKVQSLQNPASRLASGEWTAEPAVYTIKFGPFLESNEN